MLHVVLNLCGQRLANGKDEKKWFGPPQSVLLRGVREALFLQVVSVAKTGGCASWVTGESVRMI